MDELTKNETKITSTITKSTNLAGTIYVTVNGAEQPIVDMSCALIENDVNNIQTYVSNKEAFLANASLVTAEIEKFKAKAVEVGKGLNCFIF